ncbi:hypothetical protein E2C01_093176 [Portunus trituberculatus]|uniref:Uncharacterized protein n=1 Tax=Portunus trituberculatus TaxID=210409 RepID=A0A5B7JM32_PORTR|nr:hypothetical protein [Portunus trituberculatus]
MRYSDAMSLNKRDYGDVEWIQYYASHSAVFHPKPLAHHGLAGKCYVARRQVRWWRAACDAPPPMSAAAKRVAYPLLYHCGYSVGT